MASSKQLPIFPYLPEIFEAIKDHKVISLFAPTGTGKSSGFTEFFIKGDFSEKYNKTTFMSIPTIAGNVVLYSHVKSRLGDKADSLACGAGGTYTANFETASFRLCTTQVVINNLISLYKQNKLDDIIVVIDEAHHTSAENYVLLHLCNWLIGKGFGLNVVIMTATPSENTFEHLVPTKTFDIPVISFPVKEFWLQTDIFSVLDIQQCKTPFDRLMDEIVRTCGIALGMCKGNGLVFVPGEAEADAVAGKLAAQFPFVDVVTIFSSMDRAELQDAIKDTSSRKIFIGTNFVECSVTLPVEFVVDSLCCKEMVMRNHHGRIYGELSMQIISQSASKQRRGRCGRIAPGLCWRLCTREFYTKMNPHTVSNFVTGDKVSSVLSLLGAEMPAYEILSMKENDIVQTKARLKRYGLIDESNKCTTLGRKVNTFALPLEMAVFLLDCHEKLSTPDIKLVACMLVACISAKDSCRSPIYVPKTCRGKEKIQFLEENFHDYFYENDITGIIRLMCEYIICTEWGTKNSTYARQHNLNEKFFRYAVRILKQLIMQFFKSCPPPKYFNDVILSKILRCDDIYSIIPTIASKYFTTYFNMGGNYIDQTQLMLLSRTEYFIDKFRLSAIQPRKMIAFSHCAITVPTKRGLNTMNLLSMTLSL